MLAKTSTQFCGRGEQVANIAKPFISRDVNLEILGDAAAIKRSCCILVNQFQEKAARDGI
jgi:hypothetical protein